WLHARDAGALFDHAGTKALHLGIVAPRLAFGKEHAAAATRQHAENAKDDGAYKIPTHSPRHASRMRWFLLTFLQRLPRGHRSTPVRVTLWLSTDVERVAAAGLLAVQAFSPWSATCYPTRSAERVSSAQAKYERREGPHVCHPKCQDAPVRIAILESWHAQADRHAFAFG